MIIVKVDFSHNNKHPKGGNEMNDLTIDYDEMYEADNGFDLTEYETMNNEYQEEMNYD